MKRISHTALRLFVAFALVIGMMPTFAWAECASTSPATEASSNKGSETSAPAADDSLQESTANGQHVAADAPAENLRNSSATEETAALQGDADVQAHANVNVSNPRVSDGVVTWDCVRFGNYAQGDPTGAAKEPIKWRVLKVEHFEALLVADESLDCGKYDVDPFPITWEKCALRTWLNRDFLNAAFTSQEQAGILPTTVENPDNPRYGTSGGNATQDKVFLLSIQESQDGAYGFLTDQTRQAANTAYAEARGAWTSSESGSGCWWLRSPGERPEHAAYVDEDGYVRDDGYLVDDYDKAVRPACWVKLDSPDLADAGTVSCDVGSMSVSFDVRGHGTAPAQQTVKAGNKVSKPQDPVAEGYEFGGWYRDPECKTPWDFANDTVTADTTLYAKWTGATNPRISDGIVTWDVVTFGSYAQGDPTGAAKEPIKWRVLKVEDGKALLLADKSLDCRKYNEEKVAVTWETCTLRSWLNGDFLNAAFTSQEQADILTTTVENPDNPTYGTSGGNATQDKVFLLSIQEAKDGAYGFLTDQARQAANTAYAKAQGAHTSSGNGYWRLRSPGSDTRYAALVYTDGSFRDYGYIVNDVESAVRPACWVKLDSPDLADAGTVSCDAGSVSVTFDVREHGTAPDRQTVKAGNKVSKPQDPVAAGYEFGGWYRDPECKTAWNFGTDTVTADTTLYAKWTAVGPHTVTFDVQGHGAAPGKQTVEHSNKVAKPQDPVAEGYEFGGWYKDAECKAPWDFGTDTVTADTTLYAKWTGATNPRIADGVVTWDVVTFGNYAQRDSAGVAKEPIKWRVLKVEDGKALLVADKSLDCKKYNEERVAVTWETCTLRTWLNGDFLNAAFTSREQEGILTATVENPDNPTYGTSGGNATQDKVFLLSIQEAKDGACGFLKDQARQAANTAYAEERGAYSSDDNGCWWLRSPGYNTIEAADVNDDGIVRDNGNVVDYSRFAVRPACWVDLSSPDLVDAGTVSCDVGSVSVTFDVQGHGTAPAQQSVKAGNKVEKPQDPVAEGYEFGGWYRDPECKTPWDFANDTVTSATTLYAKWTAVVASHTVTFDVRGHGTAPDEQTVKAGNKVEKPQDPVAEGYEFGGWYKDAECKTPWDFGTDTVTAATTLYAKWTKVEPTPAVIPMHRLYNPNSGEHFYTASAYERDQVIAAGWSYEGTGWTAPESSSTPVYRLYNPNGGEHHYTMSAAERDSLVRAGWSDEGIGWYSDDAKTVPLYREYNPNAFANNHNYTTSRGEHDHLISVGWKDEGLAWYGV